MKLVIKTDDSENPIGWELTGETPEEKSKVNAIRNLVFFGFDDTAIEYNGRTGGDKEYTDAGTLHWIQKKHRKTRNRRMP